MTKKKEEEKARRIEAANAAATEIHELFKNDLITSDEKADMLDNARRKYLSLPAKARR